MISVLLSRVVLLVFGTLYPAYASYKTVKTKNVRGYVKWMMYWIVFAIYTIVEIFADIFVSFWCPFYYELKIVFVFWLICPATKGSSYLFRKVVNPYLSQHERTLDAYIASLGDHGYDIMRKIGSQGLDYVVHMFLDLLRKGQITALDIIPSISDSVSSSSVIISSERGPSVVDGSSMEHNSGDEEFDILHSESSHSERLYHDLPQNFDIDSDVNDDFQTVKQRPLKVTTKKTREVKKQGERKLRERKKKDMD